MDGQEKSAVYGTDHFRNGTRQLVAASISKHAPSCRTITSEVYIEQLQYFKPTHEPFEGYISSFK